MKGEKESYSLDINRALMVEGDSIIKLISKLKLDKLE